MSTILKRNTTSVLRTRQVGTVGMESAKRPSKRKSFTVEQKVQFIKLIDSGEQQISVSNKYGVKPQLPTERTVQSEGNGDSETESQVCCVCGCECDSAHCVLSVTNLFTPFAVSTTLKQKGLDCP